MRDSVASEAPPAPDRIYAIGDVHGRFDLFRRLMNIIERDQAARDPAVTQMILLGDIVDRGPDSANMVRGCMKLTAVTDRFVVLKGNHEQMMVEALQGSLFVYRQWLTFGGKDTLLSWGVDRDVVEGPATKESLRIAAGVVGRETIQWLADLPLYRRHAGMDEQIARMPSSGRGSCWRSSAPTTCCGSARSFSTPMRRTG